LRLTLALSLFALANFASGYACADDPAFRLKRDIDLRGSQAAGQEGPLFLSADRVESISQNVIEASGNVEARKAGQNFFADILRYDHVLNEIDARGKVRLEQPELILTGTTLKLQLDKDTGLMTKPAYRLLPSRNVNTSGPRITGRGQAESLELIDKEKFSAKEATYTTCPVGNEDWQLKVAELEIDQGKQVGTARNVLLKFKEVPLLYAPWADFSLNDARKSGFLPPTIGFTEKSGLDITLPYYFNLAPNYDATIYPRFLATRGLQLGGEFRYLSDSFSGDAGLEYLHNDQTDERSRWLAALNHSQRFSPRLKGQVIFQRVSDDEYFRDLSNQVEITSRSILPQEAQLSYDGDWWQAGFLVQQLQTLQDPDKPILQTPYYRLPQLALTASRKFSGILQVGLESEYTHFHHPNPDPAEFQVEGGDRFMVYPSLKLPYSNSAFFITPKIGYHHTHYNIDQPVAGMPSSQDIGLPIASLDTGLSFERDFTFRGNRYLQTLEPRAYYVYAPYRDQSEIPVFDTAQLDLSFAQVFTENQFIGGDRINDANQLTLAMTSRFIDEENGLERLKIAFGQRYYFSNQQVTMPGTPPRDSQSTDLLALLTGQINHAWRVDAGWQFDTDLGKTIKSTLSTSYQPGPGRAASVGYRFVDGSVEQLDAAFQWPLTNRLYGLFRANYSLLDNNLVEGLAGLEYNGGCWVMRGVVQRIATAEKDVSNSFFFQLELNGMGRLGASPLSALRKSIPGYTPTNEFQTP
jgi:LPS-assembly protein